MKILFQYLVYDELYGFTTVLELENKSFYMAYHMNGILKYKKLKYDE
jgi:hypothetical protein